MTYSVVISPAAQRDVKRIPKPAQRRIADAIDALADDPRPPGCTKLAAVENLYRIRVSDYRILYQIADDRLIILIVRVGHRRDIYDKGK